jgi:hypothetical protein
MMPDGLAVAVVVALGVGSWVAGVDSAIEITLAGKVNVPYRSSVARS